MDTVTLNRYWNDDEKCEKKSVGNDSLAKLLSKIEKRREERVTREKTRRRLSQVDEIDGERKRPKLDLPSVEETSVVKIIPSDVDKFTVINQLESKKREKVKFLPDWLRNPAVISKDLRTSSVPIDEIPELDATLASNLRKNNIKKFFPVQRELILWLLKYHNRSRRFWPRDVCVSAPTGSGKTLAFVLPIIHILKNRVVCRIRAVIVLPTKDLAQQVYRVFKSYIFGTRLKAVCLGNSSLEKEKKELVVYDDVLGYRSLFDIVVITPGRLVDHLKYNDGFSLNYLKFLVIDEADRVIDSVQNDWLFQLETRIPPFNENYSSVALSKVAKYPRRPQRLLLSATLSQDPEKLKYLNLFQPRLFASAEKSDQLRSPDDAKVTEEVLRKYVTPNELTECYSVTPLSAKPLTLYHIVKSRKWNSVLCFANSVSSVHKLAYLLQKLNSLDEETPEWNIIEISSKLSVDVHGKILQKFANGAIDILVTTDSLARGIDIKNVKYVVLYDSPRFAKNYVHRIGRTGRAGHDGTSLVLVTPEKMEEFQNIMETCGKKEIKNIVVPVSDLKKLEESYKNSLEALRLRTLNEKEKATKYSNAAKIRTFLKRTKKRKHRE